MFSARNLVPHFFLAYEYLNLGVFSNCNIFLLFLQKKKDEKEVAVFGVHAFCFCLREDEEGRREEDVLGGHANEQGRSTKQSVP
jgi:hypothetical protein